MWNNLPLKVLGNSNHFLYIYLNTSWVNIILVGGLTCMDNTQTFVDLYIFLIIHFEGYCQNIRRLVKTLTKITNEDLCIDFVTIYTQLLPNLVSCFLYKRVISMIGMSCDIRVSIIINKCECKIQKKI